MIKLKVEQKILDQIKSRKVKKIEIMRWVDLNFDHQQKCDLKRGQNVKISGITK